MCVCVISCAGDAIVKDEPEMVIEVVSTGDPRHMKVDKLIMFSLLMSAILRHRVRWKRRRRRER